MEHQFTCKKQNETPIEEVTQKANRLDTEQVCGHLKEEEKGESGDNDEIARVVSWTVWFSQLVCMQQRPKTIRKLDGNMHNK